MRLIVDTLIALMLAAVLGSLVWYQRHEDVELDKVVSVQDAMRAIAGQATYRAAVGESEGTRVGFAKTVSAAWFEPLPHNLLVDEAVSGAPWLDQAPTADRDRSDPRDIVADGRTPSFWYNAFRGIVRARVPMQISQRSTVELYNLVNGTALRVDDVAWDAPPPPGQYIVDKNRPARVDIDTPAAAAAPTDPVLKDFGRMR